MKNFIVSNKGMSALLVVVIIGAASILMAKGAAFLSIGELEIANNGSQGNKAYYTAESCLEEVLLQLKRNPNFISTDWEVAQTTNSCTASVTGPAENKEIIIHARVGTYERTLHAFAHNQENEIILDSLKNGL